DVVHPLIGDALVVGVGLDAIFAQRPFPVTAQRVQPGDDGGQVGVDLVVADDPARSRAIASFGPVAHQPDAVTAVPLGRLDDEVLVVLHQLGDLADVLFGINDAVQVGHVDLGGDGPFLGQDLVIDHRIQVPLVVLEHIVGVATVDAHHAGFAQ